MVRGLNVAFIDSSAWIALLIPTDRQHAAAARHFQAASRDTRFLTSNYVIAETVTWLIYHGLPRTAREFRLLIEAAERSGQLTTAWISQEVHTDAWDLLEHYEDQTFSFCDCTSFVLCKASAVDYVFSFDRDFQIMGLELRPAMR